MRTISYLFCLLLMLNFLNPTLSQAFVRDLYQISSFSKPTDLPLHAPGKQICAGHTTSYLLQYFLNTQSFDPTHIPFSKIVSQGCSPDFMEKGQRTFSILHRLQGSTSHSYNLHVFDPNSDELDFPGSNQAEKLIRAIRFLFAEQHTPYPIAIDYCTSEGYLCEPNAVHSVTLTGVRNFCNSASDCSDEWEIENIWGPKWNGWYNANELANNVLRARKDVAYILPCEGETCSAEILGFNPNDSLPTSETRFIGTYPLHTLAIAKDEKQFFLTWNGIKRPEELHRKMSGLTLGYIAAQYQTFEILEWLAKEHPDVLQLSSGSIGNTLHYAVHLKLIESIRKLVEVAPQLASEKNGNGKTPLSLAKELENPDVLAALKAELKKAPNFFQHIFKSN